MFFVCVVIAAFLIAWGNNLGVYAQDQTEWRLKLGVEISQIVLIALGLVVFAIGI